MLDWDDLKTFLMIARHHSLTGAARALGVQQPTMGRRLEALEQRAGAKLLLKTPSGYVLTPAGETVLGNVERIEAETIAIERAIEGVDVRLEGTVRLTTVESLATDMLPPILMRLHETYPGIRVDVISEYRSLNLSRREADVALRIARFQQADLVARKVGEVGFGLYASTDYVAAHGMPNFDNGADGHRVVVDIDVSDRPEAVWLRAVAPSATIVVAANSRAVQQRAIAAGIGFGCLARYRGDEDPGLMRLPIATPPPRRELWIGVSEDIRHMPRVRAVTDGLAAGIREAHDRLAPPD
jgi:DNA-binding transcriptional LysR family regulator